MRKGRSNYRKRRHCSGKNDNGSRNDRNQTNPHGARAAGGGGDSAPYALLVDKGNFKMECFYALQKLHHQRWDNNGANHNNNSMMLVDCISDQERQEERQKWRSSLSEILPASFRITKDVPPYLQTKLENELENMLKQATEYKPEETNDTAEQGSQNAIIPGNDIDNNNNNNNNDPRRAPLAASDILARRHWTCLPHAHQLGLDRSTIRKNPALQALHAWLKATVAAGHVTRQETVSMLPPVLLNVQSTDAVLDLCAAPGSKTSQLLEDLSANVVELNPSLSDKNNTTHSTTTTTTTTTTTAAAAHGGVLVANDASAPRARLLASQLRRILHHHPVALITAAPAQFWPASISQFDKILCDVPCSGDGTTRKNLGVWKKWSAGGALALHSLQLQIAVKAALQLLRVGGILCYSTCSFNPVENEAVVAELLRRAQGGLELLDCRDRLTGFQTRPGLDTWKVLCENESARELRNRQKKQNSKMQAKRQAYESMEAAVNKEVNGSEEVGNSALDEQTKISAHGVGNESKDVSVGIGDSVAVAPVERDSRARHGNDDDPNNNNNNNNTTSQPNKSNAEEDLTSNKANQRRKFEPTSLDDEAILLELAREAGLHYYASHGDVPPKLQKRIKESAFPPTADEAKRFHLERCLRCLPQDNDTGGFFVALLRKTAPLSATDRKEQRKRNEASEPDEKKAKVDEDADVALAEDDLSTDDVDVDEEALEGLDPDNKPVLLRGPIKGNLIEGEETCGKDDFKPVSDEILDPLIEYYGLTNEFDKELYMARACGESKVIFYIARPVKHLFDLGIQKRITIITSGLKAFQRNRRSDNDSVTEYRLCQEGIAFLVPHMTRRKAVAGLADFRKCLTGNGKTMPLDTFSEAFRSQVENLSTGSFVVVMEGFEEKLVTEKMVATMWKCRGGSIDGLVAKVELDEMLSKLEEIEKVNPTLVAE